MTDSLQVYYQYAVIFQVWHLCVLQIYFYLSEMLRNKLHSHC